MTCAANSEFRGGGGQSFSSRTRGSFMRQRRRLSPRAPCILSSSPHALSENVAIKVAVAVAGRLKITKALQPKKVDFFQAAHSLFLIPNFSSAHSIGIFARGREKERVSYLLRPFVALTRCNYLAAAAAPSQSVCGRRRQRPISSEDGKANFPRNEGPRDEGRPTF